MPHTADSASPAPDVAYTTVRSPAEPLAALEPPRRRCANCGADGCESFCPRCGQETHDLHRSLYGIAAELLDALLGWDGKIPRTLWALVRHPGALTTEFLAGRRARYLRPLRLYLTLSVVFFVSLSLVHRPDTTRSGPTVRFGDMKSGRGTVTGGQSGGIETDADFDAFVARHRNEPVRGPLSWFRRNLTAGLEAVKSLPAERQVPVLKEAVIAKMPNMVFALLPIFALLLRVLYLRTPVYYAEHFVFSLHNHAFAYLALTGAHVASVGLAPLGVGWVTPVILLWMSAYFFVSMRRVYGGSLLRTVAKFSALSIAYGTILLVATIVTALLTIVTFA